MVLNEKHNEQNQQKWLSRAKRERMNLSASVEEALEDPVGGGVLWGEELDEQADFPQGEKGVFPPRLSLQSRPVPALQSENVMEASSSSYPVVSSEQESATPTQNTSVLKRFAQRLTSSFAALGGVSQPQEVIESSLSPLQEEGPIKLLNHSKMDEGIQRTFVSTSEPISQTRTVSQPLELPNDDELRDRQSKQRLAGRTTRIHLETPPMITPARSVPSEGSRAEKFYSDVSQQIPAGMNTTGVRLPAADPLKGKMGVATRRELSGSGVFEPGQGDATVVNRYVTEASVVLVTLTANPGPVVIQYVTLRPRIGFTVHLTAPTVMRASFNYIVLLGELF